MSYNTKISNYLKSVYQLRKEKNPSYSIRAFSRDLNVDQSWLSRFLKGEKGLTPRLAEKCLSNLNIPKETMNRLMKEVNIVRGDFKDLEESKLEFLSDWKYWALLEYLKINTTSPKEYLKNELGVTLKTLNKMLITLRELGFIEMKGIKIDLLRPNNNWASNTKTSTARRKLQKDLLSLSIQALENGSIEDRLHSSLTVAINKNDLPDFKKKLSKLQLEFGNHAQKSGNLQEVYQLTISFFPLNHKGKTK